MESAIGRGSALVGAVVPLLVGYLLLLLIDLVQDRVASLPKYRVSASLVDVERMPEGLERRRDAILGTGPLLDRPRSILDPELGAVAVRALLARPWIREVLDVRREFPNRLAVSVAVRRPLGIVCVGPERLAVDTDGRVLESNSDLARDRFPEIRTPGAPLRRLPVEGASFAETAHLEGHGAVMEALAVLRDLGRILDHPALASLRIVEVSVGEPSVERRSGDSDIRLLADTGLRILWGRASVAPLARIEPEPVRKLDNLQRVGAEHPGFFGIALVDLRLPDPEIEREK